ncbi:hypothetical protein HBI56_097300 [Parastagonospora nodorum]|uniref:Uncharacterized protein n=1 Tax=Phaeosphaeria nodorum (strain SN15 / ATCC MYA-4574 / FGSC 10173) TaxID=321614 RepID=A0A7U2F567_PHANO|nr:hypothetical protein HBH56_026290 [Parastagonospora nodorum]QRC98942.1 hypothetical protein JI435_412830 [Parastagonospora nodorum SN15]KAH3934517.1 hypothetical protein HBH54_055750 [Parastagonospora nodorum]KAH3949728.1 hypothetical protein HBH53_083440 [Parastagonospora nodorum]KAH3975904.1 hypothetical protein HBH51_081940 [Parastagonospora nodorum]
MASCTRLPHPGHPRTSSIRGQKAMFRVRDSAGSSIMFLHVLDFPVAQHREFVPVCIAVGLN